MPSFWPFGFGGHREKTASQGSGDRSAGAAGASNRRPLLPSEDLIEFLLKDQRLVENPQNAVRFFVRAVGLAAGLEPLDAGAVATVVAEYCAALAQRLGPLEGALSLVAAACGVAQFRMPGTPEDAPRLEGARHSFRKYLAYQLVPSASRELVDRSHEISATHRAEELFLDGNTGLLNEAGFGLREDADRPMVAVLAPEGIKYFNDHVSHHRADSLYRFVAERLKQLDPGAAKVGGEFAIRVESEEHFGEVLKDLNAVLAPIGLAVTGGMGSNLKEANDSHVAFKVAEEEAGQRAPRGERPLGLPEGLPAEDIKFPTGELEISPPDWCVGTATHFEPRKYFRTAYLAGNHEPVGILSEVGWRALDRKAHVASIDLKGLKTINGRFGMSAGDEVLATLGRWARAMNGSMVDFAHLHGDEFAAQHEDPRVLEAFVKRLQSRLGGLSFVFQDPHGLFYRVEGMDLHFGLGEGTYEAADQELNRLKKKRIAAGLIQDLKVMALDLEEVPVQRLPLPEGQGAPKQGWPDPLDYVGPERRSLAGLLSRGFHQVAVSALAPPDLQEDYLRILHWAGYASLQERGEQLKKRDLLKFEAECGIASRQEIRELKQLNGREQRIKSAWLWYLTHHLPPNPQLQRAFERFRGVLPSGEHFSSRQRPPPEEILEVMDGLFGGPIHGRSG